MKIVDINCLGRNFVSVKVETDGSVSKDMILG